VDECFAAFKLKKGKWVPCTLRVTNTAIERLDNMLSVLWRARYVDLKSPGIVLLDDTVRGAKAFKVCATGDRGQRIFCASEREKLTRLVGATAATCLGLSVSIAPSAGTAAQHAAARDGAHAENSAAAPLHEVWVSRVKTPAEFWTGGRTAEGAENGVGRFGGFARRARLLSLTETSLVEKAADGKRISRLHDLGSVAALVCFELACESRYFAVEWTDGSMPTVFESNRRQRDLALLLEQVRCSTRGGSRWHPAKHLLLLAREGGGGTLRCCMCRCRQRLAAAFQCSQTLRGRAARSWARARSHGRCRAQASLWTSSSKTTSSTSCRTQPLRCMTRCAASARQRMQRSPHSVMRAVPCACSTRRAA
jgi:hypothetical protein